MNKLIFALGLALLLSACGSPSEQELLREPLELQGIATEVKLKKVWQHNVGEGQNDGFSELQPAIFGDALFVADSSGRVLSLNKQTGKRNWHVKLKTALSAGVGYGDNTLYLGTTQGSVLALAADGGGEKWRADIDAQMHAPAVAARGVVVVQTINGMVIGLAAGDGREIWRFQSTVPVLSVRGTSTPVIIENIVFIGLANGKLVALDIETGSQRWAARLASADGDSDIERITDIDATPLILGGHVVSGSYNGRVAVVDAASGQISWSKDANVAGDISEGFGNIYFASVEGEVWAYDARAGQLKWINEHLLRRGMGNTSTWVNYVVTVDYEGYLHVLSQVDGRIVGRLRVDDEMTRSPLLVNDNRLYVLNNSGRITAYSLKTL